MIIMPVFVFGSWSCYFWDFKFKTITILDPMLMTSSPSKARDMYHHIVSQLHKALLDCKNHFLSGWNIEEASWSGVYTTDLDRRCKLQNSGLYAVYYRSFCGQKIAFDPKEPKESNLFEPSW